MAAGNATGSPGLLIRLERLHSHAVQPFHLPFVEDTRKTEFDL